MKKVYEKPVTRLTTMLVESHLCVISADINGTVVGVHKGSATTWLD